MIDFNDIKCAIKGIDVINNMKFFFYRILKGVATPLWAKCEGEAHTPKSGKMESSGTPLKLRARVQGSKHLALRCYLYQWKGLEV
jgi:hypothetical protein